MRKFLLVILILLAAAAYWVFYMPNIAINKRISIKIPTGSNYDDAIRILDENHILISDIPFQLVDFIKQYPEHVKSGHYVFNREMNNRQIVNILRLGLQTPVSLNIYNIRTKEEFAGLVGRSLELDSNKFLDKLNEPKFCAQYGLDTSKILTHFMVEDYSLNWNIPPVAFLQKMDSTYNQFWDTERMKKAAALNLSPPDVVILASIVEKEVLHEKELPTVAGVYLNRLRIGMPLQADPTLVFALRDFEARRVTSYHKEFDSPYNTYLHPGLPPGPICMPRKRSIDAVLNPEVHQYLYFCANPDMSGYSIFSKTLEEQNKTAAEYRKKLNELNVH